MLSLSLIIADISENIKLHRRHAAAARYITQMPPPPWWARVIVVVVDVVYQRTDRDPGKRRRGRRSNTDDNISVRLITRESFQIINTAEQTSLNRKSLAAVGVRAMVL